jgi:hypothetical protein
MADRGSHRVHRSVDVIRTQSLVIVREEIGVRRAPRRQVVVTLAARRSSRVKIHGTASSPVQSATTGDQEEFSPALQDRAVAAAAHEHFKCRDIDEPAAIQNTSVLKLSAHVALCHRT